MTNSHNARHDAIRLAVTEAEQHIRDAIQLIQSARKIPLSWYALPDSWDVDFICLTSALLTALEALPAVREQVAAHKEDDRV